MMSQYDKHFWLQLIYHLDVRCVGSKWPTHDYRDCVDVLSYMNNHNVNFFQIQAVSLRTSASRSVKGVVELGSAPRSDSCSRGFRD